MCRRGENIYKRKDGRWEGRYIRGRKPDGAIHYGYIYRETYKAARTDLIVMKGKFQQVNQEQGSYTGSCYQWIQTWLVGEVKEKVKLSTFASYQHKIQTYILPTIGTIPLNQLTTIELQAMVDEWKIRLSASTILVLYRILNKCLAHAVKRQLLLQNPCDDLTLPKRETTTVHALSRKEQLQLEQAANNDSQGLPALLALHTGLRMGEISALQWEQIDFDTQTIQISHTYQRLPLINDSKRTQLVYTSAKTASSIRTVPFSDKVKGWLLKWKKKEAGKFVFSKNKKPMEPRLMTYHFQRLLAKAGLKKIHFHQLRHTFATRCMEAMADVSTVSALLGHASTKTTLDIYTDALMDQRRAVISAMEGSLG